MKLFTRYSRVSAAWLFLVFALGSLGYYFAMRYTLLSQLDGVLKSEYDETAEHIRRYGTLPQPASTPEEMVTYAAAAGPAQMHFSSIALKANGGLHHYRQIAFTVEAGGTWHLVTVAMPLEHTEQLLHLIVVVSLALVALLMAVFYLVNRRAAQRLMKPLYLTVDQLRDYSPASGPELFLPQTDIDEFAILNNSIGAMSQRVRQDFRRMKDFTAHAAHELQTPVAVVRTGLDNLLQTVSLSKTEAQQLEGIERALENMVRLQRSLLMLASVEAGQFEKADLVDFKRLTKQKLDELRERLGNAGLELTTSLEPFAVRSNENLCQSLVSNLLRNAIGYNRPGGSIRVLLNSERLAVSNTSYLPALDFELLYQPFYRHADTRQSGNGLGLPIVREICESNGWYLEYAYLEERHHFTVFFRAHSHR